MLNVEQFVYTAADIRGKKGYQVVARSTGISDKTIGQLESYMYPVGISPSLFLESRSLIFLDDDLVVYSRIKNAGIGYDGRANTIYNHSFVFPRDSFEEYEYDSRIFDSFFLDENPASSILPTLSMDRPKSPTRSAVGIADGILEDVLTALFQGKKIALLETDIELPQKILSLVPKPLRQISFSTLVVDPKRQPRYRLVLESGSNAGAFSNDFSVIQQKEKPTTLPKTDFGRALAYYISLIRSGHYEKLDDIWRQFDMISGGNHKDKLILLTRYFQYSDAVDEKERSMHAEKISNMLKQFDRNTFSYYFWKISRSLSLPAMLEGMAQGMTSRLASTSDVHSNTKSGSAPKQQHTAKASHGL